MPSDPNSGSLIVVAKDQPDLWRALVQEFKDVERIHILLDRRYGERRAPWGPVAYDRRARERRSVSASRMTRTPAKESEPCQVG